MRRRLFFLFISLLLAILPGCTDRTDIEDITLTLMAGLDLSEKNELLFYSVSPIFYNEAKKKIEEFGVRADSIREARARLDTLVSALTVGGKIQIIALSKRLVQHPDWYTLLDTIYRDPRLTINARIVVVDGPLHEIFHLNPPDKPRLPIHLTQLLDTANRRNLTVKTSALELQRMMNDKGTTPVVTEFKKVNSAVEVMGTALLDKRGKYKVRLFPKDTVLLQILRFGKKGELTIVSKIPDHLNKNRWLKPLLSYFVKYVDKEVKTSYQDNQFHFDVELKMEISISERYSSFDVATHKKELEQVLEKDLRQRYQKLIATFQKHQVDPVGFGVYARAYQYKEWKKVQDDWPKAFAHAKVRIKPIVSIKGFGVIE